MAEKATIMIAVDDPNEASIYLSAPDLLEALEALVDIVEGAEAGEYALDHGTTLQARAVIDKARGEAI